MGGKQSRRRRAWRWIFDGPRVVGVIEERADGWHVTVRGREIGVVVNEAIARELVRECVAADRERRGQ